MERDLIKLSGDRSLKITNNDKSPIPDTYYALNVCVYVEALPSNVMALGGEVFERELRLDEVTRVELLWMELGSF